MKFTYLRIELHYILYHDDDTISDIRRARVFAARYKRPRITEHAIMSGFLGELVRCIDLHDSLLRRLF